MNISATPDPLSIFVPYINREMAEKLFTTNPNLLGFDIHLIDNRERAAGLSQIYNEIIARNIDEDRWLFFAHEDFEIQGAFIDTSQLATNGVYGTFGVRLVGNAPAPYGCHICSNKDGSKRTAVGIKISQPTWVETLDCQSVLLHTRMLRANPFLRFDETLTFDLYAEELCLNAQENHGIPVLVVPMEFQHYSHGRVTERYWRGIQHLAAKYPDTAYPASCSFVGGHAAELEKHFIYDNRANPAAEREAD
jgi:hypothetical protein